MVTKVLGAEDLATNKPGGAQEVTEQRQMPLPVQLRDDATLENFLPSEATAPALHMLSQFGSSEGEPVAFLHGPVGSGKSHLLQASCHLVGVKALYLPLAEFADYSPEDVLAGIEDLTLVCLDDLHAVVGLAHWEIALFNLYNRAREAGCRLLIAAEAGPRTLAVQLADLRSRLAWGVVYHLPRVDDAHQRAILQFRASRRGLTLADEVASFIVSRAPRDLTLLLPLLDTLDQASLEQQRPLSIPFVKQILSW